uniref:Uncharacterized protein n=1 Tax=Human herpesvirus 2 TaxID=10310 RepID=A0A481TNL7_HHV2|nr:hypothetical protein [Human alphaherpesvirus 2]
MPAATSSSGLRTRNDQANITTRLEKTGWVWGGRRE